jgi:hypothetical protein
MRYRDLAGYILAMSLPTMAAGQDAAPPAADSPRVEKARLEDRSEMLKTELDKVAAQLEARPPGSDKPVSDNEYTDGQGSFAGLKLGVGLSFTVDVGKLDRIGDAEIVDNVVRVKDQNNGRARIMLESHYFFTPCGDLFRIKGLIENPDQQRGNAKCDSEDYTKARWGWGPFIAIQPGSGEIIDAIGAGLMLGFRRQGSNQSFNVGVGVVVDPNTRVLGNGFRADQAPPGNETEVRYRETLQTGILLLTSFSF